MTDGQRISLMLALITFPGAAVFSALIEYIGGGAPDWKFRIAVIGSAWIALGLREYISWALRYTRDHRQAEKKPEA